MGVRARRAAASVVLAVLVLLVAAGCDYKGTSGPRVALFGDSISAQSADQLENQFVRRHRYLQWSVDGFTIADQFDTIGRLMDEGPVPDVMVIELGTNDAQKNRSSAQMAADIRTAARRVASVPCVLWLNVKTSGVNPYYTGVVANAGRFNQVLASTVASYGNVRVVDYASWGAAHQELYSADGLHFPSDQSSTGKQRYANWLAATVVPAGC